MALNRGPIGKRPRAANERTWARVEAAQGTVLEQGVEEALRRAPEQPRRWGVLTDGQEDLLRPVDAAAKRYKVDIIVVEDFVHVLESLWKAAYALHPEAAEQREDWGMNRAQAVFQGRALEVAVGLRRAATRQPLSQRQREPVDKAADDIDNNRERLAYDQKPWSKGCRSPPGSSKGPAGIWSKIGWISRQRVGAWSGRRPS